jgi:cellulose/xylan binding protein with CBM9 domain
MEIKLIRNTAVKRDLKNAGTSAFFNFSKILPILFFLIFAMRADAKEPAFEFCPKGFFGATDGAIIFNRSPSRSDYQVKKQDKTIIRFSGPIFPGYKLPKFKEKLVDNKKQELTSIQFCKEFGADVKKEFSLVNGSILSAISYDLKGGKIDKPVKYRIFLPLSSFAGRRIQCNGKPLLLPKDKTKQRILKAGKVLSEVRLPLSDELELGIKFISGMKKYFISDCRHHGKPEPHFHIYFEMAGNKLQYSLHLLKAGQPFTQMNHKKKSKTNAPKKKNLLGMGSGFEVGPLNMNPMTAYSWNEGWTKEASQAPVFDSTEAKKGKYSLKLTADDMKERLGRFNMNNIDFRRVKLNPDKTYTLSAWMKTDTDGMKACLRCGEGAWLGTRGKIVDVAKAWEKYSYTFIPKEYKILNYCRTWISVHPSMKKGHLWIDDVRLYEGGKNEDSSEEPLEFGAQIKKKYKLFTEDELKNGYITLFFRNNSDKTTDCKINWQIKDYWDKIVARGTVDTSIKKNENKTEKLKIPQLPIGYYRVSLESPDKALKDELIFGVYQAMKYEGRLPFDWPLGCHNPDASPIVRALGFGLARSWDFTFKRVCPEKGKFNFKETDIVVDNCKKAKLNLMPILGYRLGKSRHDKNGNACIPDWSIEKTVKSSKKNSWAVDVSFPKIEAWKTYVKAIVSRYKDYIKAWEVFNEPNCWLLPEEYVPYLKATYEAAKEADPDCLIVGGGATSDWGGEPAPWTTKVLELDNCSSLDVLSIHMYGNTPPEQYKGQGTNEILAYLKKTMKKYGKDLPIWHTEKSFNTTQMGYSFEELKEPSVYLKESNFRVSDFKAKAQYLIRETLIDSAVGKGPYFWFGRLPNDIYMAPRRKSYSLHHTEYDGSPCPELIAANGLARMLEGRNNPQELIKLDTTTYCALYEGKKGSMLAIWSIEGEAKIKLAVNKDDDFSLNNFFGVKIPHKGVVIKITEEPVYLIFDGKKSNYVKNILENSNVLGTKFSFSGDIEYENDFFVLAFYAFNKTLKKMEADVSLSLLPEAWSVGVKGIKKQCLPQKYTRIIFPISKLKASDKSQTFEYLTGEEKASVALPPIRSLKSLKSILAKSTEAKAYNRTITVDGNLKDWDEAGITGAATADKVKFGRRFWRGPTDLSCEMRFRWDNENLYIAAIVYDDILERHQAADKAWGSDCLELFLGFDPSFKKRAEKSKKINSMSDSDFQILLAPGDVKGKYKNATGWICQKKRDIGGKIVSKKFKYGYQMEAAIPWRSLMKNWHPKKGTELIMTYQVKDAEKKDLPPNKAIFWSGNESNWMKPNLWGKLTLE